MSLAIVMTGFGGVSRARGRGLPTTYRTQFSASG